MMDMGGQMPRFRRVDLFGTLVPGFYALACVAFAVAVFLDLDLRKPPQEPGSVWGLMNTVMGGVLAIFLSFVLGTTIRGFPVSTTDRHTNRAFKFVRGTLRILGRMVGRKPGPPAQPGAGDLHDLARRLDFPYWEALWIQFEQMTSLPGGVWPVDGVARGQAARERASRVGLPLREERVTIALFDAWRAYLALQEPGLQGLVEYHEARTRMFTGMYWAGVVGAGVLAGALPAAIGRGDPTGWALGGLAVLSIGLSSLFGWRLRPVRAQEAFHVLSYYVTAREKAVGAGVGAG